MKNRPLITAAVLFSTISAQPNTTAQARASGYLTPAQISGVVLIVPAAPMAGDPRFQADMAIFRETRKLEGSPRWKLAQSDDNLSLAGLLGAFACPLGITLTPESAPKIVALLNRANEDAYRAADVIKQHYKHKRPFQVEEGDVCVSPQGKAALEKSPDYPSGHVALSWETGLILAQLSPEHAVEILQRARAFGQSRVVCGVHNLSAVEAGWMTASAVFDMQVSSLEFRKDLESARAELSSLERAAHQKQADCEAENRLLSRSPY